METAILTTVGIVLASALTLAGVVLTGRWAARKGDDDTTLEWAQQLLGRLDKVEIEVKDLRRLREQDQLTIRAASSFIDRIGLWISGGMKKPRPTPPQLLHAYVDTGLWDTYDKGSD